MEYKIRCESVGGGKGAAGGGGGGEAAGGGGGLGSDTINYLDFSVFSLLFQWTWSGAWESVHFRYSLVHSFYMY